MRKIGEVAALFSTTPRTLLYYEEQGILAPTKTTKGTRMYSQADLRRFATAQELSSLGVPLRTVRDLVSIARINPCPKDTAVKQSLILNELAGKLRDKIQRIDLIAADIEAARDLLNSKGTEISGLDVGEGTGTWNVVSEEGGFLGVAPRIFSLLQKEDDLSAVTTLADNDFDNERDDPVRYSSNSH
ncbi:MerR family transcriptional regulator [Fulvimarina sp. MAC8]|uniref:MerR family transcriptional regulator n=1 Tax=Fulvimarina sp. MAC8 TaxID=3162874 RepID=UPI0032F02ADB